MRKQIEFEIVESEQDFTSLQEVVGLSKDQTYVIYADIKERFETGVRVDQLLKQVLIDYTDADLVVALIIFGVAQQHNNAMKHQLGVSEHED
jgi:hypothetical protein